MPQDPVDRAPSMVPSMAQLLAANAAAEAVSTPPADEEAERAERPVAERPVTEEKDAA